nr:hypothetical protein INEILEGK_00031 [Klebsiella pneumoniae]
MVIVYYKAYAAVALSVCMDLQSSGNISAVTDLVTGRRLSEFTF